MGVGTVLCHLHCLVGLTSIAFDWYLYGCEGEELYLVQVGETARWLHSENARRNTRRRQ